MSSAPHATPDGTARFARRFPQLASDHFRSRYGLIMSSIGLSLGPQPGQLSSVEAYGTVLATAIEQGCNVVDLPGCTVFEQDLSVLSEALEDVQSTSVATRDELLICSHGGLVAPPGAPADIVLTRSQQLRSSLGLDATAIAGGHCMEPAFLSWQLAEQLARYKLDALDVFYLNHPEIQQAYITPDEFQSRLVRAFSWLEEAVRMGRIRFYGVASADGLLAPPQDPHHLPLPRLMSAAQRAGESQNHFRFLQFPLNMGELDSLVMSNQLFHGHRNGKEVRLRLPLLAAARQYALVAVTCSGLMGGGVLGEIPEEVKGALGAFESDAQYALYFNRSTPGLTTTLMRTANPQHARENLRVARRPVMDPDRFWSLLQA